MTAIRLAPPLPSRHQRLRPANPLPSPCAHNRRNLPPLKPNRPLSPLPPWLKLSPRQLARLLRLPEVRTARGNQFSQPLRSCPDRCRSIPPHRVRKCKSTGEPIPPGLHLSLCQV